MKLADADPPRPAVAVGQHVKAPAASGRARLLKPRSFSWHIGMLVLGIVLPAVAFIALLVAQFTASERARIEGEAQNLARILSIALSREVNQVATTLQALATSPTLDADDLRGFYEQAQKLRGQQDINFSLRDREGVTLVATRLPFGQRIVSNPPEVTSADEVAMRERRVNLSNVFMGPVSGRPAVQIMVPVLNEEPPRLVLGASLEPEFFHDILERFDRSLGWTAAILDRNAVFASREPGHEAFAGKQASSDFVGRATEPKGLFYGVNAEGVPSLVAYETDAATGWRASVNLPTSLIDKRLRWSLLQLLGAGVLLALIGAGLAMLVNRRLTGSVAMVGAMASAIRSGRPIRAEPVAVTDVAEIGRVLQDAADEARSSLGRLRRVLDNLFTFVGILDVGGRVVEVNRAPLALLDVNRDAVLGLSFWETPWWTGMPEEQRRIEAACRAAMKGETVRFDIDVRASGGKIITVDFQIVPLLDEAGEIVGLQPSGIDITARVAAQAELAESVRRSRFIAELRDRLDGETDPAAVLDSAATALKEHIAVDYISIHEIDKAKGEVTAHPAPSRIGLASGVHPLDKVYAPRTQALLESERVAAIEDVRVDPLTRDRAQIFEALGVRSCLAVPLTRRGRWVGALTLGHGAPRGWDADIDFIRNIAERIWVAFENARLMQALARSEERLQIGVAVAGLGLGRMDYRAGAITLDAKAAGLFALPPDEAIPRGEVHARFHPDDAATLLPQIAKLVGEDGDGFMAAEHRVLRPDGSIVWLSARKQVIYEADGSGRRSALSGILAVHDITDRKELEDRQRLLVRELHHRVKNSLATVQAIASTSLRSARSIEEFREGFAARLDSLSRTHSLLTENVWTAIDLEELLRAELAPYAEGDKITLEGPAVRLPAQMAVALGMAFHELATNAAKHGSLSSSAGRLSVSWSVTGHDHQRRLSLAWRESGGPPVTAPATTGFGSRLLSRILGPQISGRTEITFAETGLEATVEAPLPEAQGEEFETQRSGHDPGIVFT